jgi:hypothetical protein
VISMVPKCGNPVLGQIAVYSGMTILISYPGNWFSQHSMAGNSASSPDFACSSVYRLMAAQDTAAFCHSQRTGWLAGLEPGRQESCRAFAINFSIGVAIAIGIASRFFHCDTDSDVD